MRALIHQPDGTLTAQSDLLTIRRDAETDEYVLIPDDEWDESTRVAGTLVTVEARQHEAIAAELETEGRLAIPTTPQDTAPGAYEFGRPEIRHEEGATYLLNVYALVHAAYWDEYADRSGGTSHTEIPDPSVVRSSLRNGDEMYLASFSSGWGSEELEGRPCRIATYTEPPNSGDIIEPSADTYNRVAFALQD